MIIPPKSNSIVKANCPKIWKKLFKEDKTHIVCCRVFSNKESLTANKQNHKPVRMAKTCETLCFMGCYVCTISTGYSPDFVSGIAVHTPTDLLPEMTIWHDVTSSVTLIWFNILMWSEVVHFKGQPPDSIHSHATDPNPLMNRLSKIGLVQGDSSGIAVFLGPKRTIKTDDRNQTYLHIVSYFYPSILHDTSWSNGRLHIPLPGTTPLKGTVTYLFHLVL